MPPLELLTCRSHIQFMCPQTRFLVVQEQVCLTYGVGAHFLTCFLVLAIFVNNGSVADGVYDVNAALAHLASQGLRQLSH